MLLIKLRDGDCIAANDYDLKLFQSSLNYPFEISRLIHGHTSSIDIWY